MKALHTLHHDIQTAHILEKNIHKKNWLLVFLFLIIITFFFIRDAYTKKLTTQSTISPSTKMLDASNNQNSTPKDDDLNITSITITKAPFIPQTGLSQMQSVIITNTGFTPKLLTVKKGSSVAFVNETLDDVFIISSTGYAPFNLGLVSSNDTVTVSFLKDGSYGYTNKYKGGQTGTVVVQ